MYKMYRTAVLATLADDDCDQSFATNALKHLMDQLQERLLQID